MADLPQDCDRTNRHRTDQVVRRFARHAGIDKTISPHSLRHSFITAALDAGVPLRDVQQAASNADPRTTMGYGRVRQLLDQHATCIGRVLANRTDGHLPQKRPVFVRASARLGESHSSKGRTHENEALLQAIGQSETGIRCS